MIGGSFVDTVSHYKFLAILQTNQSTSSVLHHLSGQVGLRMTSEALAEEGDSQQYIDMSRDFFSTSTDAVWAWCPGHR